MCCFLLNVSTLFTPTYCSTVIKKLMQRPGTVFPSIKAEMFLLTESSFVTSSECSFAFWFLAVFKILFQVLTHFCCLKDQSRRKDCDLPEEMLSHFHSSGVYRERIISVLPRMLIAYFPTPSFEMNQNFKFLQPVVFNIHVYDQSSSEVMLS